MVIVAPLLDVTGAVEIMIASLVLFDCNIKLLALKVMPPDRVNVADDVNAVASIEPPPVLMVIGTLVASIPVLVSIKVPLFKVRPLVLPRSLLLAVTVKEETLIVPPLVICVAPV